MRNSARTAPHPSSQTQPAAPRRGWDTESFFSAHTRSWPLRWKPRSVFTHTTAAGSVRNIPLFFTLFFFYYSKIRSQHLWHRSQWAGRSSESPCENTDIDVLFERWLVGWLVVGRYLHPHASPSWILGLALRAQQSHENPVLETEPIMCKSVSSHSPMKEKKTKRKRSWEMQPEGKC